MGASDGVSTLWTNEPGSGIASLTKRNLDHFNIEFSFAEDVAVLNLDAWISSENVPTPHILKMDVEGHELEVLRGAAELLESIHVVQFEFGECNVSSRTYFQDFFHFFESKRFDLFRLSPHGLIPIRNYREEDETFLVTNYFARRRLE